MLIKLVSFLFYLKCVSSTLTHYKASCPVADLSRSDVAVNRYETLILEAAAANVDLLVLSPTKIAAETTDSCATSPDNYDEVVEVISKAAKTGGIYVVAPVYEKTRSQHQDEASFNNMVFDRNGAIVAATPVTQSECNDTESKIVKFNTDFDVTFALVTEEDIVLQRIEYFEGIKNFIVFRVTSEIPYLFAEQFTSSWSFVNKVNVVSPSGLFGANMYSRDNLLIAELQKSGGSSPLLTTSSSHQGLHHLHLNIKPLNTMTPGYTETACDGSFCCNFYVKTRDMVRYAVSAHSAMVQLGHHKVALQLCAVSSKLQTEMKFDKITITANFTKDSAQFPSITTMEPTLIKNLILEDNSAELYDTSVLTFSVLSRDYTRDDVIDIDNKTDIHTEYISYENVNVFFDYVWIRVRVLIFIVSIYILEML